MNQNQLENDRSVTCLIGIILPNRAHILILWALAGFSVTGILGEQSEVWSIWPLRCSRAFGDALHSRFVEYFERGTIEHGIAALGAILVAVVGAPDERYQAIGGRILIDALVKQLNAGVVLLLILATCVAIVAACLATCSHTHPR